MAAPVVLSILMRSSRGVNREKRSEALTLTGYRHPAFAQSLSEFGAPRELPRCKGWVLTRQVPGFPYRDAMGCYPLFSCQNWSQLRQDLAEIKDELITLAVVTDPFGDYDPDYLQQCFQIVKPFKQHYIIDLACPADSYVNRHHRRYARTASRQLAVEIHADPANLLADWLVLYEALVQKHHLKGILAFSASSFTQQLQVPGIVAIRAIYEQATVAMLLWYVDGEAGYYHLGASSPQGYSLRASYALFWAAIEYFQTQGLRWLNLGAGAGLKNNDNDGLSNFKRGWSTGTRTAYFCGRIFDSRKYAEILQARRIAANDYFPAYRQGEFG